MIEQRLCDWCHSTYVFDGQSLYCSNKCATRARLSVAVYNPVLPLKSSRTEK